MAGNGEGLLDGFNGALKGVYEKLENGYYDVCDELQEAGVKIYDYYVNPLETHGVPSFPVTATTIVALLATLLLLGAHLLAPVQQYNLDVIVRHVDGSLVDGAAVTLTGRDGTLHGKELSQGGKVFFNKIPRGVYGLAGQKGDLKGFLLVDVAKKKSASIVLAREGKIFLNEGGRDNILFSSCGSKPAAPCASAKWNDATCSYLEASCNGAAFLNVQVNLIKSGSLEPVNTAAAVTAYNSVTKSEFGRKETSNGSVVFNGVRNGAVVYFSVAADGFSEVLESPKFLVSPKNTAFTIELDASGVMHRGVFAYHDEKNNSVKSTIVVSTPPSTQVYANKTPAMLHEHRFSPQSIVALASASGYAVAVEKISVASDFLVNFTMRKLEAFNGSSCAVDAPQKVVAGERFFFNVSFQKSNATELKNVSSFAANYSCGGNSFIATSGERGFPANCSLNAPGSSVLLATVNGTTCVPATVVVEAVQEASCEASVFPSTVRQGENVFVTITHKGIGAQLLAPVKCGDEEDAAALCLLSGNCFSACSFKKTGQKEIRASVGGVECKSAAASVLARLGNNTAAHRCTVMPEANPATVGTPLGVRVNYFDLEEEPAGGKISVDCGGVQTTANNCFGKQGNCFAACTPKNAGTVSVEARTDGIQCAATVSVKSSAPSNATSNTTNAGATNQCQVIAPGRVDAGKQFEFAVVYSLESEPPGKTISARCGESLLAVNACANGLCTAKCVLPQGSWAISAQPLPGVSCGATTNAVEIDSGNNNGSCSIVQSPPGAIERNAVVNFTAACSGFANAGNATLAIGSNNILPASCKKISGMEICVFQASFNNAGTQAVMLVVDGGHVFSLDVNVTQSASDAGNANVSGNNPGQGGASTAGNAPWCRLQANPGTFVSGSEVEFLAEYGPATQESLNVSWGGGQNFSLNQCGGGTCAGKTILSANGYRNAPAVLYAPGATCSAQLEAFPAAALPATPSCIIPDAVGKYSEEIAQKVFYANLGEEPPLQKISLLCDEGNAQSRVVAAPCSGTHGSCSAQCVYAPQAFSSVRTASASTDGAVCKGFVFLSPVTAPGCSVKTAFARTTAGAANGVVVSYWEATASAATVDCGEGTGKQIACASGACSTTCSYASAGAKKVSATVAGMECGYGVVTVEGTTSAPFCEVLSPSELLVGSNQITVAAQNVGAVRENSVVVDCAGTPGSVSSCDAVGENVFCKATCNFQQASAQPQKIYARVKGSECNPAAIAVASKPNPNGPQCEVQLLPQQIKSGEYAEATVSYSNVGAVAGGRIEVDCGNGKKVFAEGCADGSGSCTARCPYGVLQPAGVVVVSVSSPASCAASLQIGLFESNLEVSVQDKRSSAAEQNAKVVLFDDVAGSLTKRAEGTTGFGGKVLFNALTAGENIVARALSASGTKNGESSFALRRGRQEETVLVDYVETPVVAKARDEAGGVENAVLSITCSGLPLGQCMAQPDSCGLVGFAGELCRVAATAPWHLDGYTDVVPGDASQQGVPPTVATMTLFQCGGRGQACCSVQDSCQNGLQCNSGKCGVQGESASTSKINFCWRQEANSIVPTASVPSIDFYVDPILAADYAEFTQCVAPAGLAGDYLLYKFEAASELSECLALDKQAKRIEFKGNREGGGCQFTAEEYAGATLQASIKVALATNLANAVTVPINIHVANIGREKTSFLTPLSLKGAANKQFVYAVNQRVFAFDSGTLGELDNDAYAFVAAAAKQIIFAGEEKGVAYQVESRSLWQSKSPVGGGVVGACADGDVSCCTAGWCTQTAADQLVENLKKQAKQVGTQTVFHSRADAAQKNALQELFPEKSFSYSTIAQVQQDVVLPNENGLQLKKKGEKALEQKINLLQRKKQDRISFADECTASVPPAFTGTGSAAAPLEMRFLSEGGGLTGFLHSDGASIVSTSEPTVLSANQLFNQQIVFSSFNWPQFSCVEGNGACVCSQRFSAPTIPFNPKVSCDNNKCVKSDASGGAATCEATPAITGARVDGSGATAFSQQGLSAACSAFDAFKPTPASASELYGALADAWDNTQGAQLIKEGDLAQASVDESLRQTIIRTPPAISQQAGEKIGLKKKDVLFFNHGVCSDPDAGEAPIGSNTGGFNRKTTITAGNPYGPQHVPYTDYCYSATRVAEYYCQPGTGNWQIEFRNCACSNGACTTSATATATPTPAATPTTSPPPVFSCYLDSLSATAGTTPFSLTASGHVTHWPAGYSVKLSDNCPNLATQTPSVAVSGNSFTATFNYPSAPSVQSCGVYAVANTDVNTPVFCFNSPKQITITPGPTPTATPTATPPPTPTATPSPTPIPTPTCSNACAPNAQQCSGNTVQQCAQGSDGCYAWNNIHSCSNSCSNGECVPSCSIATTPSSTQGPANVDVVVQVTDYFPANGQVRLSCNENQLSPTPLPPSDTTFPLSTTNGRATVNTRCGYPLPTTTKNYEINAKLRSGASVIADCGSRSAVIQPTQAPTCTLSATPSVGSGAFSSTVRALFEGVSGTSYAAAINCNEESKVPAASPAGPQAITATVVNGRAEFSLNCNYPAVSSSVAFKATAASSETDCGYLTINAVPQQSAGCVAYNDPPCDTALQPQGNDANGCPLPKQCSVIAVKRAPTATDVVGPGVFKVTAQSVDGKSWKIISVPAKLGKII